MILAVVMESPEQQLHLPVEMYDVSSLNNYDFIPLLSCSYSVTLGTPSGVLAVLIWACLPLNPENKSSYQIDNLTLINDTMIKMCFS